MTNNFTYAKSKRISVDYMANVTNEEVDAALNRVFLNANLTERKLQSMVVYLALDIDLVSAEFKDLRRYIGSYLHIFFQSDVFSNNPNIVNIPYWLSHIANREIIPEEDFNFLYKLGREGACSALIRSNIFQRSDIYDAFTVFYPINNTICFFCDISQLCVSDLRLNFSVLKSSILYLKKWDSRIDWFKSGSQLNQKKMDAANLYFSKQKIAMQSLFNLKDVRDYFYSNLPDADKELVFRKIRANYFNKKSREESDAKPCNFSLRKHSEKMLDDVAKSNGVSRSIALDAILHSGSKLEMQELFEKGIKKLPVQIKKFNDGLLKFSLNIGPSNSVMAYQANVNPAAVAPFQPQMALYPTWSKDEASPGVAKNEDGRHTG